jgi:hypothetical protein
MSKDSLEYLKCFFLSLVVVGLFCGFLSMLTLTKVIDTRQKEINKLMHNR